MNAKSKSKQTSRATPLKPSNGAGKRKFASSTVQFLYDRYVGNDEQAVADYEQELLNVEIARKLYELRTKAGLSQRELAKRVGTSASAICRLEDADYEGHSLSLLKRIADALGNRIEVRFVPRKPAKTA